ncbi:MAG: histidinol phosphate phosphatase domain-containing protein [Fusobacteriota bacterium]
MNLGKRYEFHTHTFLSDGVLLLSEHIRRAEKLGYACIGITDHADISNIDEILTKINSVIKKEGKYYDIEILPGVELTHVPPELIDDLAKQAKEKGAKIVIVHGETIVEPVTKGTNLAAVSSKYVDVLAHPGLIKDDVVKKAAENNVFLELSARRGHSLSNGHVAKKANQYNANLIVNSDGHTPGDFITQEFAYKVAISSGLSKERAYKVVKENSRSLLKKINKNIDKQYKT